MAINDQNDSEPENTPAAPVAAVAAAPLARQQNGPRVAATTPAAQAAVKKALSKPTADLSAAFTDASNKVPVKTTPSLAQPLIIVKPVDDERRAKERFFKDISIIRLNMSDDEASGITAARNELRDEVESTYSYDSDSSDYDGEGYLSHDVWEDQWQRSLEQSNAYWDDYNYWDAERETIQARMDARAPILEEGDAHEAEWVQEQGTLTERVEQNEQDRATADAQQTDAANAYYAKVKELYGSEGPMSFGDGPDAIETDEEKLRKEAWDKNRDAIEAEYVAKGITKEEFAAMERSINGEAPKPGDDVLAVADKARAAGLTGNLYVALNEKLKATDPTNPYLNTKDSKGADTQKAVEDGMKASREFVAIQNEHVQDRINELNDKREALAKARTDNEADAKEKLKATTNMQQAEKKIQDLNTYREWLSKNEGTSISREEFEKNVPESMRESFMRDMAAQNMQADKPAATADAGLGSRSIASAATSGIDAPSAKDSFNAVAPVQPEAAPATPAPQAPVPEQKPAPAPVSAPAM